MKIANKITLSFFSTASVIAIVSALVFYFSAKAYLTAEITEKLEATLQSRTNHIETYLSMLKISIGQLSKSTILEEFLKSEGLKKSHEDELFARAMTRLARTKGANPSISDFFLLDTNGKVVASSNKANLGLDKSTDAYFLGGQKNIYIKDAYLSHETKIPSIAASAPILDRVSNQLLGVLVARVKLDELDKITTETTGLGKTGEIFILNKYGYIITPLRFFKDVFLKLEVDAEHALKENVFSDYRGVPVLGTHAYVPQMRWLLLAEISTEEAFEPLAKLRATLFVILLVVAAVSWLLGKLISGFLTASLYKLQKGTEIIGSGKLDYKVATDANDEVGQLSRAFNKMTENLKRSTTSIENLNKEIEERKAVEEALHHREKELRQLSVAVEQSPVCVVITDINGDIQYVNPKFVSLTGYTLEEVLGKNPRVLKSGMYPSGFYKDLWSTIVSGKEWKGEFHNKKKNGELYWESASISPIRDRDGVITNFIAVKEDITERKITEKALKEATEVKSKFTSMVSHELRNPLAVVKESIDLLLDCLVGNINEEQKDILTTAKSSTDRLGRLVNNVLDFQKMETGKMEFDVKENDIIELIRTTIKGMGYLTKDKNVSLALDLADDVPKINFDKDKITQVVVNLVGNAIKFTDKGEISVRLFRENNDVHVIVKDTGPGIRQKDLPLLFQAFGQLDSIKARKKGGTGLGLAISKEIILAHKGKIWVESKLGEGSSFHFTLPIQKV